MPILATEEVKKRLYIKQAAEPKIDMANNVLRNPVNTCLYHGNAIKSFLIAINSRSRNISFFSEH